METFADVFNLLAGPPAVAGLILTAAVIFLSSHWRLSLAALLVQYLLVALTLTRLVQPELAIVRGLVGMLVVPILYMTARRADERRMPEEEGRGAEGIARRGHRGVSCSISPRIPA